MAVGAGALGHFGDARRAAIGSTLVERVVETGSLVIRKLGGTRAREINFAGREARRRGHRLHHRGSVKCVNPIP